MTMTATNTPAKRTRRSSRKRLPTPGRTLFRSISRKKEPVQMEHLSDLEVLRVLFNEEAAAAILAKCGSAGLANFSSLGEHGPRGLLNLAGIDEGGAARILAVFEVAARAG